MTDWNKLYRERIGGRIAGLVWMPITCDTPQLVSEMQAPHFSFSGAVYVRFEERDGVCLSWQQHADRFALATGGAAVWRPHSLDRVQASGQAPWGDLLGATLERAELFASSDDPQQRVVGVKHTTTRGTFWIGSGGIDFIGDGDDLWVGVDCDPPNCGDLVSLGIV